MSKRTRGSARAVQRRPGARPASPRVPGTRAASPRLRRDADVGAPSQLEAAAEIAEDVVDDRPAAGAEELNRTARAIGASHPRARVKAGSLLAARAATEYVYVAQDIRRIIVVTGGLFVIMFALWVLIVLMRVIPLPFY